MVSAKGGQLLPVRTGYEAVVANRCADKFAYDAKGEGKVTKVTKDGLTIQYGDDKPITLPLGTQHGKAAGAVIPHAVVTDYQVGDTFEEGGILTWNTHYFQRDRLNPGGVSMKGGVLARVALIENSDTLEDGSAISRRLSDELSTPISKMKTVLVSFDQAIRELVQPGQKVDLDTPLCILEEAALAELTKDDDSLVGLSKLANQMPKAKFQGEVSKLEVVYYGHPEDMHESLRTVVEAADKARAKAVKASGKEGALTGAIEETTFVGGEKLTPGTAAITVYMDTDLPAGIGDKAVFDNALKTIVGRVMEGRNESEDGQEIDALFGYQSISNRILLSAEINGVTNMALKALGKRVASKYHG